MFGCRVQSEGNFPGPDIEPDPRGVIVAALLFILCFVLLAVLRSISFHGFRFPVPKLQCGNVFDRKRGQAYLMSRHLRSIGLVKHARIARAGRRVMEKMKPDPFSWTFRWILDEPLTFRNRLCFGLRAVIDENRARDAKRLIGPVGSLA